MKLTKSQAREIRALRRMKDEDIDLTDVPEVRNHAKVVVGKFYRPIKKSLTIRIDVDVLAWVKQQGKGYQTRINGLLREVMETTTRYPWYGISSWEHADWTDVIRENSHPRNEVL